MSLATIIKSSVATPATDMAFTENGALSHASSGSARVDFFYGAMRNIEKDCFVKLLDASYEEDALHTLKLIAYIRDCRGGKGERQIGRYALERLAECHPRELVHNLKYFADDFGRFDDLMALMGTSVEKDALDLLKRQLEADLAIVKAEKENINENVVPKKPISLCAKWIPSEKKALDKKLQMNKKLSRYMNITPAQLRKMYLSPLRERLRIVERYMCAGQWDDIDLGAVPSVAMHIYGKPNHAFERNMKEKFFEWKRKLVKGETKVNAKALFPHQVVSEYFNRREVDPLLEAQWNVLLEEAQKMGDMRKTLVLSDVSGSMSGQPMEVSIALGLLVSSLALDEYKDLVLTFEAFPKFHHIKGDTLKERVQCLQNAPWGGGTDFAAAFRAVLDVAIKNNLSADQFPERLIVISDMQFNSADRNYETNYQVLKREYTSAGYAVPHLVFWNVRGKMKETPVQSGAANVSLVSGFSTAILKSVLAGKELTPLQTVLNVVLDERYDAITLPPCIDDDEDGVML